MPPKSTVPEADLEIFKKVMKHIIHVDGCFIPDQESFELVDRLVPAAVVEVMLYNNDGQFLLQNRDDKDFKGWHTPGGRFSRKGGEKISQACLRSLRTDGINPENVGRFRQIWSHSYQENEHPYAFPVIGLIACHFDGDPKSIVQDGKVQWFTNAPKDLIVVPGKPEITVPHGKYIELFRNWYDDGCFGGFAVE